MFALVMRYLYGGSYDKVMRDIKEGKCKALETEHSIGEIPEFYAFCEVPRSVAMQMETHKKKHGFYSWMVSARPDRNPELAKEYSRDQTVRMVMKFTHRGIIDISHYRMCHKAEKPTREFMDLLKESLMQQGFTQTAERMEPMCFYRNGVCSEPKPCGLCLTAPDRRTRL